MLKNYLKIALRTVRHNKASAFINVLGLAVGLACCLLIVLFVQHERSYDHFHTRADRIYRVEMDVKGTQQTARWNVVPVPAAPLLKHQFPDIEQIVRIGYEDEPLIQQGENRFYEDFYYETEPAFFDIFDFTLLQGNASALARPNTIVLSESIARKYFGDDDPMGATLTKVDKWSQETTEYEVVGVLADPPVNSHFHPHLLASLATGLEQDAQNWRRIAHTYALLRDGVAPEALAAQFTPVTDLVEETYNAPVTAVLMPLLRIHLHSIGQNDLEPQGDIRYVWIFSAIAFLILLIACINYMNLATARAAQRAKEVGVRKVVGAQRRQLVAQFIGEAVLQTTGALLLGLGLTQLLLPAFNHLMEQPLALDLGNTWVLTALAATALLVGIASGSYPAFLLSGYRPASVLKGSVQTRHRSGLRKGLVVFQFSVSVALIACTVVIQQQLHYVQHTRLGFDQEQAVIISARNALGAKAEAFKQALLQQPSVRHVSLASGVPGHHYMISFSDPEDIEAYAGTSEGSIVFDHPLVDYDYLSALGLELVAGRTFSPDFPGDAENAYLINETAARALGWADPVGKTFTTNAGTRTVIGVVRDYHVRSMKEEIRPLRIQVHTNQVYHVAVKLSTTDLPAALAGLKATWEQFVPVHPFEYSFLDEDFAAMYRTEQRLGQLFNAFAGLAIFVACLGLFGLAAFTAEQRTKEIGIRKVLGASIVGLAALLSKDLLKLVLVAIVLAGPVAYLAMSTWLDGFAYRIEISWPIFLIAGLLALLIALLTVSYQAVKAALADPIRSLRYE